MSLSSRGWNLTEAFTIFVSKHFIFSVHYMIGNNITNSYNKYLNYPGKVPQ